MQDTNGAWSAKENVVQGVIVFFLLVATIALSIVVPGAIFYLLWNYFVAVMFSLPSVGFGTACLVGWCLSFFFRKNVTVGKK